MCLGVWGMWGCGFGVCEKVGVCVWDLWGDECGVCAGVVKGGRVCVCVAFVGDMGVQDLCGVCGGCGILFRVCGSMYGGSVGGVWVWECGLGPPHIPPHG